MSDKTKTNDQATAQAVDLNTMVRPDSEIVDAEFMINNGFVYCEKRYYRRLLWDDTFLEVDTNDMCGTIILMSTKISREITKVYLPNKMTKARLLSLISTLRG